MHVSCRKDPRHRLAANRARVGTPELEATRREQRTTNEDMRRRSVHSLLSRPTSAPFRVARHRPRRGTLRARARRCVCVLCSRECASGGGEEEDPDDDMLRLRVERQHLFSSAVDAVMRVPRAELRRGHTLEVRVTCRVK